MDENSARLSPRRLARIGGLLYLVIIVIGIWGEMFVRGKIIVWDDATATVARLRAMESLWRLGIAGEYILLVCAITLTAIFFFLLRPVSPRLALLTVFVNLVSIAIEAVATMGLVAALFPLANQAYLSSFTAEQRDALTSLCVRWHAQGFGVALFFFGFECLILGHLIRKSGFLPRAIGVLMQIAGACYLINSLALIVAPAVANRLYPLILVPSFIGEASLCLWLLLKGVNEEKWKARAEQCGQV